MSPQLRVGARSDVGRQRHNNQDSLYAGSHLIAVADGVGGAAGGEVASRLTIRALMPLDTDALEDPQAAVRAAAHDADTAIRDRVSRNNELAGMSTTLTAILATDRGLLLAHIGDSRAYRLRDDRLSQLTHDHTLVQSLIDEGQITETEALTHPRRSWIMRAVDGRGQPDLDLDVLDVEPGDRYLLCSDGLSSYVDESAIAGALSGADPQVAADRLTDLALDAGGPDNISCIVADQVDGDTGEQAPILGGAVAEEPPEADRLDTTTVQAPAVPARHAKPRRSSIGRRLAAVAAVIVVLVAGGVAGVALYVHRQWYVAPSAGKVAIYQGVQGSAAGLHLSHLHVMTNIPVTALPQDDRAQVNSGIQASGGSSGAASVVANLRHQACALATPEPTPTPSATTKAERKRARAHPKPPPSPPAWCGSGS